MVNRGSFRDDTCGLWRVFFDVGGCARVDQVDLEIGCGYRGLDVRKVPGIYVISAKVLDVSEGRM